MTKCRVCGDEVVVAETASGKALPLDAKPTPGYVLAQDASGRLHADGAEIYKAHVCANAKLTMKL